MSDVTLDCGGIRPVAEVRVYVNERGVSVPAGATAGDAVGIFAPELGLYLAAGRARLTDSRGLPIESNAIVHGGLILRVLPVRESARGLDAAEPQERM